MKTIVRALTLIILTLLFRRASLAQSAPPFKPAFEIVELDRARVSGDKHLIWFHLKTKVNLMTMLDVCIRDTATTPEPTCFSTITAKPEDTSQGIFIIARLTGSTTLSIRKHNLRDEVAGAKLPAVPVASPLAGGDWRSLLGLIVAAALAIPIVFLIWRLQSLRRQVAQVHIHPELDDLNGRYKALNSDMVLLSGRFNQISQDVRKNTEGIKAIPAPPPPPLPERALQTLDGVLIQPQLLVASSSDDGLLSTLWLAAKAWHSDPQLPIEAIPRFVRGQGFEAELVDVFYVEGSYEFKSTDPSGRWMLSGVPGSPEKLLTLLARKPSKSFERLKELVGVEAAGEVFEVERPCRLAPTGVPERYEVRTAGVTRMMGANTEEATPAKLAKRLNAVLQMGAARPSAGTTAQFHEVQEAAIRARALLKGLEHRVSAMERKVSEAPAAVPTQAPLQTMAAAAGASAGACAVTSSGVGPVAAAPPPVEAPVRVESEPAPLVAPVAETRKASLMFPDIDATWWNQAVAEAAAPGGSPEEYFQRVLALCEKFKQALLATNLNYLAIVAWVRWDLDDQRFRVIRARTSPAEGAFAQEPERLERPLLGRELFQLLVGIEDKSRKGLLLFVPAGTFSVDQHPTVLTRILLSPPGVDPPDGPREIKAIRYAAELAREKGSYILNQDAELVLEYRTEEDDLGI